MSARTKLNVSYATGSTILAALIGGGTGSWVVFGVALAGLLDANVVLGEIRLKKRGPWS